MIRLGWMTGLGMIVVALGVGLTGCPEQMICRQPTVAYMGRCIPPCVEDGIDYCVSADGSIVSRADASDDARTDVASIDARDAMVESGPLPCSPMSLTRCGDSCVDTMTHLAHCGACGNACVTPANGNATCTMGQCGIQCNPGFADCDQDRANGCEVNLNDDLSHCGTCDTRCSVTGGIVNATPQCSRGMCGIASCNMGFGNCDMNAANGCEAVFESSTMHCGQCGNSCASRPNAAPTCASGMCGLGTCNTGFANCDMNDANGCETNTDFSIMHCGRCGMVCPGGANGGPACMMGMCTLSCAAGFQLLGGLCVSQTASPRPIAPLSLGDATLRRPTFRWELSGGFDGAVVELCRDRACTMVIETIRAMGTSARPMMDLPSRSVVFWRLRGRVGVAESMTASPTWIVHVPLRDATSGVDTSSSPHLDVNGDGLDDLIVGSPGSNVGAGSVSLFHGRIGGVLAMPTRILPGAGGAFGNSVSNAGDVNGDGYGDVLIGSRNGSLYVFHGGMNGVSANAARTISGLDSHTDGPPISTAGDVNADGYSDIVANISAPGGPVGIFLGSPSGIGAAPATVLAGVSMADSFGFAVAGGGDVNGDGYCDVVVGAPFATPFGRMLAGTASVFHGGPMGMRTVADRLIAGQAAGVQLGRAVANTNDVNGDGYSDIAVGEPFATVAAMANTGDAKLFIGSALGITGNSPDVVTGGGSGDLFGAALGGGSDINGDGLDDVIVGALLANPQGRNDAGTASVFLGNAFGPAIVPSRVIEGSTAGDALGSAVACAGDVDGDGFGDMIVGVPGVMGLNRRGFAQLHSGSVMGISVAPSQTFLGGMNGDVFGQSVASLSWPTLLRPRSRIGSTGYYWLSTIQL